MLLQVIEKRCANAKWGRDMPKENPQLGLTEMTQRMQAPFVVNGTLGPQVERFLEMQASLLKEAEAFPRHWFERRNDAIETAIDVLHQMNANGGAGPAGALQAMADWQRGSLERLGADAQEWTALFMRSAAAATTTQVEGTPTGSDKPEMDKADGKSSAKTRAGHATPV